MRSPPELRRNPLPSRHSGGHQAKQGEEVNLSKLVWSRDSGSELQRRDVRQLLAEDVDLDYIRQWAPILGVEILLEELLHG